MENYKKLKEVQDYYSKKHIEHEELIECYVYLVFGIIIVALIMTIYDWICR